MQLGRFFKGFRFPLFWQMILSTTLLVFLGTSMLWFYLHMNLNDVLNRQADTFGNSIAHQMAESAAEIILADDHLALNAMLNNMIEQNNHILKIEVFDHNNEAISAVQKNLPLVFEQAAQYQVPIRFQDVIAGSLKIRVDKSPITNSIHETIKVMSMLAIAAVSLLIGFGIYFARQLTQPLKRLQSVAEQVAQGNLQPPLPQSRNDEVGDLVRSFDQMLQGLRDKASIENKFSSYISKDVADDILANLNQKRMPLRTVRGSVLFIDIVGFTSLCERTPPTEVGDILNQYYFLVHQAAKMYRGSVDKYIGDGAMITFGVTKRDNSHALNGVCAAQIFLRLIQIMNEKRIRNQQEPIEFRLGLHCGDMMAGTIGSDERMEFTVVGDTVNTAARLCSHSAPNRLLISDTIFKDKATQGVLVTEPAEEIQVKGKIQPLNTHSVLHLSSRFNRILMQQHGEVEAMQDYA